MKNQLILKIEDYEGPIHLLLEMFKTNKLEITLLNIDEILDQYLDFINSLNRNEILIAANYLDLAAEIVVYKSKKILDIDNEEEEEIEVLDKEELISKILEYKSYKEVTKDIEVLKEQRSLYLSRDDSSIAEYLEETLEPISTNKFEGVVEKLFAKIFQENSNDEKVIIKKDLSIKEYINELEQINSIEITSFLDGKSNREKVIYFLAILNVLKKDNFYIEQNDNKIFLIKS